MQKVKKFLLRFLLALIFLFVFLTILFSIPAIQTELASIVTKKINERYDTDITVERIGLKYNGDLTAKNVLIRDHHQDTLIFSGELNTSILSLSGIAESDLDLLGTSLEDVYFNLVKYQGEASDNLSIFSKKFTPKTAGSGTVFKLDIATVEIANGRFDYTNEELETPEVLRYTNVNTNWDDFKLEGPVLDATINGLSLDARLGYAIRYLEGEIHYDPDLITLLNYSLKTANSELEGNLKLDTSDGALDDFNTKVAIDADFDKATISTTDIQPFYPDISSGKLLKVKGQLTGFLNNFIVKDLRLTGMNTTSVVGTVRFKNLIKEGIPQISGKYRRVKTSYFDLKSLLPQLFKQLPQELAKLGIISFSGSNTSSSQFVNTDGSFETALGKAVIDLQLSNLQEPDNAGYSGDISLLDFNIGALANLPKLGRTSLEMSVKGKGFIQEGLNTQLNGTIDYLTYNQYKYKNITVFGNLRTPVFNGEIFVDDPELKLALNGILDISKDINNYDFNADITYANLNALNFVADSTAILRGSLLMDMRGTTIDDAAGKIIFTDASYRNTTRLYQFQDFAITSSFDKSGERTISINSSDIIEGTVSGKFKIAETAPLFRNAIGSLYTNYQPETLTEGQYMDFDFTINNKIVEVFVPEIEFEPETIIRGSVVSNDSEFKLVFKSPEIKAFDYLAQNIEVRVDNKNPLFNTYIKADTIGADIYGVKDFNLINVTLQDTLFMRSEFKGGTATDDRYDLSIYHTINPEGNSVVGFKRSEVLFKDNQWYINENSDSANRIVFDNNFRDVTIENLRLSHKNELIELRGVIKDSTYKDIESKFTNVDLSKITPDIDSLSLAGRVNGQLEIIQEKGAYFPTSSLTISKLAVNETYLGDLDLEVKGNSSDSKYFVQSTLKNETLTSLNATGVIFTGGSEPTIDLDLSLKRFKLAPFSPLGGEAITNIRGFVDGTAKMTGSYKTPDLSGRLLLDKAGLTIPYLNVDFSLKDRSIVNLSEQRFVFDDVAIRDTKYNTEGLLNGYIENDAFKFWELDLTISSDRLLVLDTKQTEESLYYGTAFIKGLAQIVGPTDALDIIVEAETEKGTVFKIPIDDTEAIGDNSYITFLSPEEKQARINGIRILDDDNKGIELAFDLDIDQDAEIEIEIDGSVLRGRGAGILYIEIDTNDKFNMWGDYTVYSGVFNFKYGGFVSKQFKLRELGNIRWDGNPTQAIVELSAVYRTEANPSILLENPSINRKIPVEVVINLNGELLQPEITFDIEFPSAGTAVVSELEYRLSDRATREVNAISLVTQNTFLTPSDITASGALNNLFETTSALLSGILFNNNDGVFDVGVDIVQSERNPSQDVQSAGRVGFTLSTQISNRVLINGKVGVPTGGVSESLIVGDVEIEFLINEDGSLRAQVFNRQNDIQFIGETEGYTQGVAITYAVDFNRFRELIQKIFKGRIEEVESEVQQDVQNGRPSPNPTSNTPEQEN